MKKTLLLLLSVLACFSFQSFAQDDEFLIDDEEEVDPWRGWSIGLNFGAYFASKETGGLYSGNCGVGHFDDPNGVQCYTIAERLSSDFFLKDWQYITNFYQIQDYSVPYDSYPQLMKYNPAIGVGINIKYLFNRYNAIVFNSNYSAVKAVDVFTLVFVGGQLPQNGQADTRVFQVTGEEDRISMNLGYRAGIESNEYLNWYLQGGGAALFTTLLRNEIRVADRDFQLFLGAANPNQIQNYNPKTSVGFGFYFSAGFEFFLSDKYTFDVSLGLQNDKVILHSYKERVWNKWLQATFTI